VTKVPTVFEAYGAAFTEGGLALITESDILSVWVINTAHRSSPGFKMQQET
jgi:hypothetical protein